MKLDRKSGIPFYIQLKEQIRRNITSGQWSEGYKLPTERDLALQMEVSRNTVSQAYKELEGEGVLSSSQGKGTFVACSGVAMQRESRKEKVLRIIDTAMEEAVGLGFSIDDFVSFAHVRGMEKKDALSKLKVAFMESNNEQLEEFSRESNLGPGVTIIPIKLEDMAKDPARARERLDAMDMVVTSFYHVSEVKGFLSGSKVPVIGIGLEPKLETMVKIARMPVNRPLVLVCDSLQFAEKVKATLSQAGIYPELEAVTSREEDVVSKALIRGSAVVVSSSRKAQVEKLALGETEVIEFCTYPDAGSLNLLRSTLLELKKN
ncbi:MAG TPA: GntR family transcriptional regulator [Verrucomicrobiae bacterium]|nr:GntR family transcriptional regulator [Verrucomicrobiae bacterium]